MSEGEIQEQLNVLNKKFGGGAKLTRSMEAVENAPNEAIERLLKQCTDFSQERTLVAAQSLKTHGHVPASLAFSSVQGTSTNCDSDVQKVAMDLAKLVCS